MTMRELRERAGLTQEMVGGAINVDQGAVSNWERAVNRTPRKNHKPLAELYGVTVDELLAAMDETERERGR